MENKKGSTFIFSIIAIILGVSLFKKFDFETFFYQKPWLMLIYFAVFGFALYNIIKINKNKSN